MTTAKETEPAPLRHRGISFSRVGFAHESTDYRVNISADYSQSVAPIGGDEGAASLPNLQATKVINDLSFDVLPTQNVAIVGPSGSGA